MHFEPRGCGPKCLQCPGRLRKPRKSGAPLGHACDIHLAGTTGFLGLTRPAGPHVGVISGAQEVPEEEELWSAGPGDRALGPTEGGCHLTPTRCVFKLKTRCSPASPAGPPGGVPALWPQAWALSDGLSTSPQAQTCASGCPSATSGPAPTQLGSLGATVTPLSRFPADWEPRPHPLTPSSSSTRCPPASQGQCPVPRVNEGAEAIVRP